MKPKKASDHTRSPEEELAHLEEEIASLNQKQEDLDTFINFGNPSELNERQFRKWMLWKRNLGIAALLFLWLVMPQWTTFWLSLLVVSIFLQRITHWQSLRREFGRELYPMKTFIGALLVPGWFKRNSRG